MCGSERVRHRGGEAPAGPFYYLGHSKKRQLAAVGRWDRVSEQGSKGQVASQYSRYDTVKDAQYEVE